MLDCVHFHCGPVLAGIEQHMMAISIYLGLGSSLRFTNLALKPPVYSVPDKLFCPLFSDLPSHRLFEFYSTDSCQYV